MQTHSTDKQDGDPDEVIDADAESLWVEEIRRRDAEIRAGTAKLKPLDQVLREARELLTLNSREPKPPTPSSS